MKPWIAIACLLAAAVGAAGAADGIENVRSLGWNSATTIVPGDGADPSRNVIVHHDGTFEDAFGFQFGGVVPGTYYGAMAEGFFGLGARESYLLQQVVFYVTQDGSFQNQTFDLYVWDQGINSAPGAVLFHSSGNLMSNVPMWPEVGENFFPCGIDLPITDFSIGYWADFSGGLCGWYMAADRTGISGHPWANVAPGIGYPEGWQDAEAVWGPPIGALGVGADIVLNTSGIEEPVPSDAEELSTWGLIKQLYR